ncbi:rhodanese-like domain-containing protein [Hamadaea sp. NPDC050747]|uniref:rhodanese-like domain-containing protein n=1 Tax=Hamadaea sp. NPDC050747 TaxID=3155789 RepID=UPI0033F0F444
MREIDQVSFAAAHAEGAAVVDVREPDEYLAGHVPGARPIPLGQLPEHLGDLPRDEPVYLICASGNRSLAAAGLLARAGFDAVSVTGGTGAWQRAGRTVVRGAQPSV